MFQVICIPSFCLQTEFKQTNGDKNEKVMEIFFSVLIIIITILRCDQIIVTHKKSVHVVSLSQSFFLFFLLQRILQRVCVWNMNDSCDTTA